MTILQNAFERIDDILSCIPEEILTSLKIPLYKEQILNKDESMTGKLFLSYVRIFEFIAEQEGVTIDPAVYEDFITLNILEYLNGCYYDHIFDDKDVFKLPVANILFRNYIELAKKLKVDINEHRDTFELYFYEPNIVDIGQIEMDHAIKLDTYWDNVIRGFATSVNIVNHFVDFYIKKDFWKDYFTFFLLYRQLLDDVNDFSDDYRDGKLKSYGILGLVEKYKQNKRVNLKNPVTAISFQIFFLKHCESLYKKLMERFNKKVAEKMDVDTFYSTLDKMKKFQVT